MIPILAVLLHGDDVDFIYFLSSIFMVALPITAFSALTYFVLKGYRKRERRS